MDEQADMAAPVTRGELREELAKLELKIEVWGGALADRIGKLETRVGKLEKRFDALEKRFDALEKRVDGLYHELARHTNAILEAIQGRVSVIDEKYADLPGRVARLEREVFAPKRTPRRQPRRRKAA